MDKRVLFGIFALIVIMVILLLFKLTCNRECEIKELKFEPQYPYAGQEVTFTTNIESAQWTIDNQKVGSTGSELKYTFNAEGKYIIKTFIDEKCAKYDTVKIGPIPPPKKVELVIGRPDKYIKGQSFSLTGNNPEIEKWVWNIDGIVDSIAGQTYSHTFNDLINHKIKVKGTGARAFGEIEFAVKPVSGTAYTVGPGGGGGGTSTSTTTKTATATKTTSGSDPSSDVSVFPKKPKLSDAEIQKFKNEFSSSILEESPNAWNALLEKYFCKDSNVVRKIFRTYGPTEGEQTSDFRIKVKLNRADYQSIEVITVKQDKGCIIKVVIKEIKK